eukprot:923367-Pyramimonas_sp.AAC.1
MRPRCYLTRGPMRPHSHFVHVRPQALWPKPFALASPSIATLSLQVSRLTAWTAMASASAD